MKKIYVAGAYTGNNIENMRKAIEVGDWLLGMGFFPFIPHLTGVWDLMFPHEYEVWMKYDKEWLLSCDCLLRLDGESKGADREVMDAILNGIPVYFSTKELLEANNGK